MRWLGEGASSRRGGGAGPRELARRAPLRSAPPSARTLSPAGRAGRKRADRGRSWQEALPAPGSATRKRRGHKFVVPAPALMGGGLS